MKDICEVENLVFVGGPCAGQVNTVRKDLQYYETYEQIPPRLWSLPSIDPAAPVNLKIHRYRKEKLVTPYGSIYFMVHPDFTVGEALDELLQTYVEYKAMETEDD